MVWPLLLIPLLAPRRTSGPALLRGEVTAYHPGTDLVKGVAYWAVRPHPDGGYEWQTGPGHFSSLYTDFGRASNIMEAVWNARQAAQRVAEGDPTAPPVGPDTGPPVS